MILEMNAIEYEFTTSHFIRRYDNNYKKWRPEVKNLGTFSVTTDDKNGHTKRIKYLW